MPNVHDGAGATKYLKIVPSGNGNRGRGNLYFGKFGGLDVRMSGVPLQCRIHIESLNADGL